MTAPGSSNAPSAAASGANNALIVALETPAEGCAGAGPFTVRVEVDPSADPSVYFEEIGVPEFPKGFPRVVVWPYGFEAARVDGKVVISSSDGEIEVQEGDVISVSGQSDGDRFYICGF